jgi:hypothetical protein
MLRRLASFAERRPKSAAKVIFALAIALVVVTLGVLVAIVDMGNLFQPPYPSETTPLSWDEGSVVWTAVDTIVFTGSGYVISMEDTNPSDLYAEYDGWGRNYSSLRFSWGRIHGTLGGLVVNDSDQQELSAGVEATVESYVGGAIMDGQEVNYSLVVTDLQGNGAFDRGDQITFKVSSSIGASAYEDEAYTLALVCLDPRILHVGEFSFAFHDGEFYSWESSVLTWDQPWWE